MVPEQNNEQIRAENKRYVEFALEMMNLKPSFARKLNPSGLSPMHLAVQNDQTLVVRTLLKVDKDLARVKGKAGQTPLHFAADHEALDLLVEFLEACPECITDVNIHGQTAFQVAVKNGRYEAAKLLASWICRSTHKNSTTWERVVLNGEDTEGNTVLHIAAQNNDPQMVSLLLKFNVSKNKLNLKGQTALDISEGQNNGRETRDVLGRAKCRNASAIPPRPTLAQSLRSTEFSLEEVLLRDVKRQLNKFSNESLNALLVVYALIVTTTYQACLTPPGGFTQENNIPGNFTQGNITNFYNISLTDQEQSVGVSVLDPGVFNFFYLANSLTFGFTVFTMIALLLLTDAVNGTVNAMLSYPLLVLLFICYSISVLTISPTDNWSYFILPFLAPTFPLNLFLARKLYYFNVAAWRNNFH
ncbi:hypothetical protein SLEP1_g5690 [Rubroshorea leprosula]|uniref:PGG domain-containing protein n=1 Tax=Rubroshorea leprosula TaxID=152421 RepID=A0AAV5I0R3_9ROSI|nr:hypothetical protein SLEP1_g5690 [Rubroshorea leprosula]